MSASALSQATDMNKVTRRNFLGSQAPAILNSTLLDNLLMYKQPNIEALWIYLWTLIEIPSPASVLANYQ